MRCVDRLTRRLWAGLLAGALIGALCACGGGGGGSTTTTPPVNTPAANAVPITVDAGPSGNEVNLLYTSVTICAPQSSNCQTIDHILVDTGSSGLRLLVVGAVPHAAPAQALNQHGGHAAGGLRAIRRWQLYAWGPVVRADVHAGQQPGVQPAGAGDLPTPAVRALSAACAPAATDAVHTADCWAPMAFWASASQQRRLRHRLHHAAPATGFTFRCATADCKSVVPSTVRSTGAAAAKTRSPALPPTTTDW